MNHQRRTAIRAATKAIEDTCHTLHELADDELVAAKATTDDDIATHMKMGAWEIHRYADEIEQMHADEIYRIKDALKIGRQLGRYS